MNQNDRQSIPKFSEFWENELERWDGEASITSPHGSVRASHRLGMALLLIGLGGCLILHFYSGVNIWDSLGIMALPLITGGMWLFLMCLTAFEAFSDWLEARYGSTVSLIFTLAVLYGVLLDILIVLGLLWAKHYYNW